MSELDALVRGVLESLDGAGPLADWLQEHDREKEAVLLRRRMKAWQTERAKAPDRAAMGATECLRVFGRDLSSTEARQKRLFERADRSFRDYIRSRFLPARKPKPVGPHTCRRATTCCCSVSGTEPDESCPVHGGGEWPPRCEACGRMMKWIKEGTAA